MAVAKSYKDLPICGEPYEKNKRMYVVVECKNGHRKEVRWYTDAEYAKMYPEDETAGYKKLRSRKDVLGFKEGYITIFKGNTALFKEWFKEHGAVYRTFWGWSISSEIELPQVIPAGLEPKRLLWEDVAYVDEDELKTQSVIDDAVAKLIYDESPSSWQGEVGDRIERLLTVVKVIELEGYYGKSTFYLFEDESGNEYCWTTAARQLELGETYEVRGSVKAHQVYKGKNQTVLTRCKVN